MDMSQYMDMFMEEAREHLQTLNAKMLELEENPGQLSILDEIFRSAHTLKGMSATMGFERVAELTHDMENVLSNLRSGQVPVTTEIVDVLFRCLDALENMVDTIGTGQEDDVQLEDLIQSLRLAGRGELGTGTAAPASSKQKHEEATVIENQTSASNKQIIEDLLGSFALNQYDMTLLQEADRKGFNCFHIRIDLDEGCVMKAARAYMAFRNMEELGEIIKSVPPSQDLEDEKFDQGFDVIYVSQEKEDKIAKSLESISEVNVTGINQLDLDSLTSADGGPASTPTAVAEKSDASPVRREAGAAKPAPAPAADVKKPKGHQTVRVDIERLDNLMNLVSELVINKTRLEQISTDNSVSELNETIEAIGRITTDLQSVVMKVRMVPIEQVFNRFPRMVRDLAKDLGKDINLIVEGKETELDRTVIDEIGDPLVHLIRNSIDHGIEQPAERRQKGKSVESIVRLVAKHEGNNVIIEVEDDGRGIDPAKIRSKVVEKGLMSAKDAEQLDDQAAVNLIFMAGFSTAEKVSDVSGRGVGLDAVRTKIESLSGSVEIDSKPGIGTKFKIRLPLTLAIIQALLVNVREEIYAIPLAAIDETTSIELSQIKNVQSQEVMLQRGNVLPLLRVDRVLECRPLEEEPNELYVVVVRKGDKKAGLIVDSLIGQQEIVIKSLGKLLTGINGIAGATILGNGHVSLILDVGTLL